MGHTLSGPRTLGDAFVRLLCHSPTLGLRKVTFKDKLLASSKELLSPGVSPHGQWLGQGCEGRLVTMPAMLVSAQQQGRAL